MFRFFVQNVQLYTLDEIPAVVGESQVQNR